MNILRKIYKEKVFLGNVKKKSIKMVNKIVVVLLIISIVFSIGTVLLNMGISGGDFVATGNAQTTIIERNNAGPASGVVGFKIVNGGGQ